MERLQPLARLFVALLLTLSLAGFAQAVLAGGEPEAYDGSGVPGIVALPRQAPQAPRFLAVTGRIEAVEKSLFFRRPEKVAIDVPSVGTLRIDDTGRGEELKQHVGDLVTLIATPKLLRDGMLVLAVHDYEVHEGHPS